MASSYNLRYSKKLPKNSDSLINRNTLFRNTLRELNLSGESKILEIGCDKGYFVRYLQGRYGVSNVFGIDLNKEAIHSSNIPNLYVMDATQTKFKENSFDKIYTFHVIEHIPDLRKFFKELDRITKKGSIVVLGYPWELFRGMCSLRQSIKVYKTPFLARKLHIHKLNPKKIKEYIKGTSFKHKKSMLLFALLPQYLTILVKN